MLYLSFDAETDGLYGPVFAIGAVVLNEHGERVDAFAGAAQRELVRDPWVKENCLPNLAHLPDYPDRAALREAFWRFYMKYRGRAVIAADVPVPVEAGLLRACVEDDPQNRTFLAPYPLIDVASALFAAGVDPDIDRQAFTGYAGKKHCPLSDAHSSGLALLRALEMAGK
ncbi:MAG: hypothetical protein IJD60_12345 [Clostridia bacterium]|nr:hypothetical protein [Clostridia bacterium]